MQPPKQDFRQTLARIDEDEKVLALIKRHPFGIIKLYVEIFLAIGVMAGLIYYLLPEIVAVDDNASLYAAVGLGVVLIGAFLLIIAFAATVIYNQNQLIVTDKTITQTLQLSLFNKKTSQLSVTNIEDVTANSNGFFPTILGYGRLLIETAGEQENFHFDYCPHADHYAKLILEARQVFLDNGGVDARDLRRVSTRTDMPSMPQYAPPMPQPAQTQPAPPQAPQSAPFDPAMGQGDTQTATLPANDPTSNSADTTR